VPDAASYLVPGLPEAITGTIEYEIKKLNNWICPAFAEKSASSPDIIDETIVSGPLLLLLLLQLLASCD